MIKPFPRWDARSTNLYKGGKMPSPPPPPDPPVTERTTEVVAAQQQVRMDQRKRKGLLATQFGGETGGYKSNPRTLLGGGG